MSRGQRPPPMLYGESRNWGCHRRRDAGSLAEPWWKNGSESRYRIRVNETQTSFQLEVATCIRRLDKSLLYGFVSQTSLPETVRRSVVGDSISLDELALASS